MVLGLGSREAAEEPFDMCIVSIDRTEPDGGAPAWSYKSVPGCTPPSETARLG
jgi:hypothetical protein